MYSSLSSFQLESNAPTTPTTINTTAEEISTDATPVSAKRPGTKSPAEHICKLSNVVHIYK